MNWDAAVGGGSWAGFAALDQKLAGGIPVDGFPTDHSAIERGRQGLLAGSSRGRRPQQAIPDAIPSWTRGGILDHDQSGTVVVALVQESIQRPGKSLGIIGDERHLRRHRLTWNPGMGQ